VNRPCFTWPLLAAILGLALSAYAQGAPTDAGAVPDWATILASGGPLPLALAVIAWMAGRHGGVPVTLTVQFAPEALQALRDLKPEQAGRGGRREE
jgi:hypothetical protein